MRINIHQKIALAWLIGTSFSFVPVIESARRADANFVIAWGISIVTVMILTVPALLRWQVFRRWYGWVDALSEQQRQALARRDLRRYYQTAFEDGYLRRVMPYLFRILCSLYGLMVVDRLLPNRTGQPAFDALILFYSWYPMGVMMLIIASIPLAQIFAKRRGQM